MFKKEEETAGILCGWLLFDHVSHQRILMLFFPWKKQKNGRSGGGVGGNTTNGS